MAISTPLTLLGARPIKAKNRPAHESGFDLDRKILRQGDFDVVHLNSTVLAPVAGCIKKTLGPKSPRILMHVREFLEPTIDVEQISDIRAVDQFVCIDISTEQRLLDVVGRDLAQRSVVINNPFVSSAKRDYASQFFTKRDDLT